MFEKLTTVFHVYLVNIVAEKTLIYLASCGLQKDKNNSNEIVLIFTTLTLKAPAII